jgi:hypothetical protein
MVPNAATAKSRAAHARAPTSAKPKAARPATVRTTYHRPSRAAAMSIAAAVQLRAHGSNAEGSHPMPEPC